MSSTRFRTISVSASMQVGKTPRPTREYRKTQAAGVNTTYIDQNRCLTDSWWLIASANNHSHENAKRVYTPKLLGVCFGRRFHESCAVDHNIVINMMFEVNSSTKGGW